MALPLTTCSQAPVESHTRCKRRTRREHLAAAIGRLGLQQKDVQYWWQCSHVYVTRVLSGADLLPEARVHQLPEYVQAAMVEEDGADLGLLVGPVAAAIGAIEAARQLLLLHSVPMRMAHATIDEPAAEPRKKRA